MSKTKKFKRVLSYFLASAMLMGNISSVPVYAAEPDTEIEEVITSGSEDIVSGMGDSVTGVTTGTSTETPTETPEATPTETPTETTTSVMTDDGGKNDPDTVTFPEEESELFVGQGYDIAAASIDGPIMEISEECFGNTFTGYDTYYYADGITYTYKGEVVTFISESTIEAGGTSYNLKNKKTEVTVTENEEGTISVQLSGLSTPVGGIPGEWNSGFGGAVQIVYQTDIPGQPEVRSNKLDTAISFAELKEGTYHLTRGQIYEKVNSYSPGYDFGDGNGKVKERCFGVLPDIAFTVEPTNKDNNIGKEYWGVQTEAKVYDDFENDIWLQYQHKDMQVGATADLYPWRLHQIVTDTIHNDVARPNFHFEIISGDSISLNKTESNDKAIVTAEKPGTSIVKVTYDAVPDYKGQSWDAISDVNTAYAVYTVGEEGTAKIKTNDEFQNWRHYDTIYYTEGKTTPYTFTVDTEGAESVKVTLNGLKIQGEGNSYTANLENRSNIIGIETKDADGKVKSMYRVIDARFIEVNIENTSFPDKKLGVGDTAKISFRGITMPVYKLATIYNPCFGGGTWVNYRNAELGEFKGKCSQWDLATRNSFNVTFPEEGEYLFHSDNGIYCSWWGDDLGSDKSKQGQGAPNTNANTLKDYFSFLPDFTVSVEEENYTGTVDSWKVVQMIENLPSVDVMTLRDKRAVDSARKLYNELEEKDQSSVTNYDVLEAAEKKIQELLKVPFIVSLNKEILTVVTEEENGHGGYYYKVSLPEGVDMVQLERYQELAVLDNTEKELHKAGTAAVDIKNIAVGKENYLVLKEQNADVCDYIYFENTGVGFEVSPKVIYPGTEVTVTLKNFPDVDANKAVTLYTKYKTNIPGLGEVKSSDAKNDITKLSVLKFTVPQETGIGTYHMTDGFVEKEVPGQIIQGMPRPNTFLKMLEGKLPEINITVTDENHVAADAVIDKIDALGEITSLEQEADVKAARKAYDELTDEQKKLVTNLEKLEEAEAKIEELKIPTEDGYVTIDIERFTIGQGFYREPVKVAFEAGQTVKDILKMLEGDNLLFNTAETYLSGIKGADAGTGIKVPEYISEKLGGPTTEEAEENGNTDDILGEFDYYTGSGWYYFVNNEAPNVGVAEYYAKPGDVIRLQFTLCWGMDLAGTTVGDDSEPVIIISNKDEALRLLAEVNSAEDKETLLADGKIKAAYDAVAEIVQNALEEQENVDEAAAVLKAALEKGPEKPEEKVMDLINIIDETVTFESKAAIDAAREAYDALTAKQKENVKNYQKLLDAEEAYAKLTAEKTLSEYKEAIENYLENYRNPADYREVQKKELAAAIANGKLNISLAADKDAVDQALEAAKTVIDAIKTDAQLTEEEAEAEKADKASAKAVEEKISVIGTVTLDSKEAIEEARKAYDALTDTQKKLVENYQVLKDAEAKLKELSSGSGEDPTPTPTPEDPTTEQKTVTLTNKKYGICLIGKGLMEEMELVVTPLASDSTEVSLMRKAIPSAKGVTKLYDVKLMQDGKEIAVPEGCELSLNVNEKYNDKELSMLFCVDGKVKEVKGTVKDGVLTVPFEKNGAMALVLDVEKDTDTDNKNTNKGSNGTGGSSSGGGTYSGSSGVKTGDEMPLAQMLWMLAVSGCVIVLALKKKSSKAKYE